MTERRLAFDQSFQAGKERHGVQEKTSQEVPCRAQVTEQPVVEQVEMVESDAPPQVLGSTNMYDKHGKIRLIPTPSPDPKGVYTSFHPLNLPTWRKWTAIGVICFFGALSISAEMAVGSLLPVFLLEYSGLDAAEVLRNTDFQAKLAGKRGLDPLAVIPDGVAAVSLARVYLLVPLSIGVGRRPVLLLTATLSWAGGLWAGCSGSLEAHLAARVVHGLGAGAVEALLPLIAQDMVFIHQRNRALSTIIASQGPIAFATAIVGPYIAVTLTWRWIYWITSVLGIVAWVLIIVFVPETRYNRSEEELCT
ncbi:Uu.00g058210.m01.CDS01 [Anthostomella pinea]|uniref:Uu.00g058210.m01.CDS01 n=1 Tax=Anthostomella pinea TaxID=933095 RepID=A0AAI8VRW6_9PEZI|nr:Uu.00g058210.m01.CDS01 [Anthostomella pinea]